MSTSYDESYNTHRGAPQGGAQPSVFNRNWRNDQRTGADGKPLQKVNVWINIGYVVNEGQENERFISLPFGLALDTMAYVSTKSSNKEFADQQKAKNALLDDFLDIAKDIAPGNDMREPIGDTGLVMQIRRISDVDAASDNAEENAFIKRISFGKKAA